MDDNYFFQDLEDHLIEVENFPNSAFSRATKDMLIESFSHILNERQMKNLIRRYTDGNSEK